MSKTLTIIQSLPIGLVDTDIVEAGRIAAYGEVAIDISTEPGGSKADRKLSVRTFSWLNLSHETFIFNQQEDFR